MSEHESSAESSAESKEKSVTLGSKIKDRRWNPQDTSNSQQHESAIKHVTGRALYIDDLVESPNQLHIATGKSVHAHATIKNLELDAVRRSPGVVDVITFADIPGDGDVGAVYNGDPLLANGLVEFVGQPIFAV
ncbi:MAG: xanthine dehydrogenase large subunit, partial [Candidatus Azotimanducaceae bacterium]